jgi:hypothetical protein
MLLFPLKIENRFDKLFYAQNEMRGVISSNPTEFPHSTKAFLSRLSKAAFTLAKMPATLRRTLAAKPNWLCHLEWYNTNTNDPVCVGLSKVAMRQVGKARSPMFPLM